MNSFVRSGERLARSAKTYDGLSVRLFTHPRRVLLNEVEAMLGMLPHQPLDQVRRYMLL